MATDLTTLASNPTIQPDGAGNDLFVIARNNMIQLFGSFAAFSHALGVQLAAAHPVKAVGARGSWDSNSVTVTGRLAVVRLQ